MLKAYALVKQIKQSFRRRQSPVFCLLQAASRNRACAHQRRVMRARPPGFLIDRSQSLSLYD